MRDSDLDRLFQLPPSEFTKARNALAAGAGSDGAAIRGLEKPPLGAWAINQLFWKQRAVYDALIESAGALRRANKAVLTGHKADIRAVSRAHEEALDAALKKTVAVAEAEGQRITDATRQAIAKTLRALPSDEPPGRLTRTLQPGGFEMLAGITPAARFAKPAQPKRETPGTKGTRETETAGRGPGARELARARDIAAAAVRALRETEQQGRRDEFEKARAAREADKARALLETAREALAEAERAVQAAERGLAAAEGACEKAEGRAKQTAAAALAARDRSEAAQAALDALRK